MFGAHPRYPMFTNLGPMCPCPHCSVRRCGWLTPWIAVLAKRTGVSVVDALHTPGEVLLSVSVTLATKEREAVHAG